MWSVILNLEDTASSEYVAVAEAGEDFLESTFEHGGEFNILSVDPLVRCDDCRKRKTPDCPLYEIIVIDDGRTEERYYRKIDHTADEGFCYKGERRNDV